MRSLLLPLLASAAVLLTGADPAPVPMPEPAPEPMADPIDLVIIFPEKNLYQYNS